MKNSKMVSPTTILIISTVCIIFIGIIVSTTVIPNIAKSSNPNITNGPAQEKITYVVKEYNGKIAVFEKGSEKPFKITQVNTADLPKTDKEILKNGIEVDNQKGLSSILEDYCS